MQERKAITRRRLIAASAAGTVSVALAGAGLWPLYRYLAMEEEGRGQATVSVPRALVDLGQVHFFQLQGHPAVVLQIRPGEFVALSAVCTHLGCIVTWQPKQGVFLCPCHAGAYSSTGEVLSGPPPAPLRSYAVAVDKDNLIIG